MPVSSTFSSSQSQKRHRSDDVDDLIPHSIYGASGGGATNHNHNHATIGEVLTSIGKWAAGGDYVGRTATTNDVASSPSAAHGGFGALAQRGIPLANGFVIGNHHSTAVAPLITNTDSNAAAVGGGGGNAFSRRGGGNKPSATSRTVATTDAAVLEQFHNSLFYNTRTHAPVIDWRRIGGSELLLTQRGGGGGGESDTLAISRPPHSHASVVKEFAMVGDNDGEMTRLRTQRGVGAVVGGGGGGSLEANHHHQYHDSSADGLSFMGGDFLANDANIFSFDDSI